MLPNISSLGLGSVDFAAKLLDEVKVAVVPGAAFGCDTNIRLSYACSKENIEEGINRIADFIKSQKA
jgi:aspartate aminotransferase